MDFKEKFSIKITKNSFFLSNKNGDKKIKKNKNKKKNNVKIVWKKLINLKAKKER